MTTGEAQAEHTELRSQLQRLAKGLGVQKPTLASELSPALRALWDVTASEPEQARNEVTRRLTALIDTTTPPKRVQPDAYRQSLLVYFNITAVPDRSNQTAVKRQEDFYAAHRNNPSAQAQRRHVANALPQMEQLLAAQLREAARSTPGPANSVPERPSGKRALLAVAGAVVIAVVVSTLYATHGSKHQAATGQPSASTADSSTVKAFGGAMDASSANAPVRAVSVAEHELPSGTSWAWSTRKQFSASDLNQANALSDSTAFTHWFVSRGGTPTDSRSDIMTLVGNAKHTVTILNAEASKQCSAPMSGTLVRSPNGGQENSTGLYFDLDQPQAIAQEMKEHENVPDYFGRHTYTLKPGEQGTFNIKTSTTKYNCTYVIKLTVLDGTKKVTEQVTNNGKPFALTATVAKDHLPQLNKYRAVYLGGTESPTMNDKFQQVDPKTCTYLTLTRC